MRRISTSSLGHRLALAALVAVMALPTGAEAQRGPNRRGGEGDRQALEQRFRARMDQMMKERLDLTDPQAEELTEVLGRFDGPRRDLARQERATRRRSEALLIEGSDDQEEAAQLLERVAELRALETDLFEQEQSALLEFLTPIQVLQLHSFREQMGQRIRQMRGRDGDNGRRRGRGERGDQWLSGPGGER